MQEPLVMLRHTGGLVITGIPITQGRLMPEEGIRADVPVWWDVRSLWPDGSVKWLMLHAQADEAGELSICSGGKRPGLASLRGEVLSMGGCALSFPGGLWRFDTPDAVWELTADNTDMPGLPPGADWSVELLEDSPIAPLLLLKRPGDLSVEWLLRMDGQAGALHAMRRVSVCRDGLFSLNSSEMRLSCSGAGFPALSIDARGLDDLAVEQSGRGARLADAGARRPARITTAGDSAAVFLWPADAGSWSVTGGTSFRHELCFYTKGYRPPARVSFAPGYLAGTGALSPSYAAGEDPDRLLFPGFESGYRRLLDMGRLSAIKDDPACFGLFHFGDWPLNPGQYGAEGRCYTDNEYDTACAYYQGFAAFGEQDYMNAARRCSVHMADVDCDCLTGDMRYHGYSGEADDHASHRSGHGDMGHWWTDGLWLAWYLHGDPWCRRAALALTAHVCGSFPEGDMSLRRAWAVCERNLGWPLVVAAAACEAEPNPGAYALAARICSYITRFAHCPDAEYEGDLADEAGPVVWWRTAMEDGSKPFMLGVLMEGMERFHRLTGSQDAAEALVALARYIADKAWKPWRMDFSYEINAFGRGHRDINAQQLTPLFLRGLGYAYELTGEERLRGIAMRAFHACLWTLHAGEPNGKDIALICRGLGAFAAMTCRWAAEAERAADAMRPRSCGIPLALAGKPAGKYNLPGAYADEGRLLLTASFRPGSTDYLNLRALAHIDGGPGRCALSIVTFYDFFCVRLYDESGMLIETLDSTLPKCVPGGWKEGETHSVEVHWRAPGRAKFSVDGACVDIRPLHRPLSGSFTRLFTGARPGGWTVKGDVRLKLMELGPGTSGLAGESGGGGTL